MVRSDSHASGDRAPGRKGGHPRAELYALQLCCPSRPISSLRSPTAARFRSSRPRAPALPRCPRPLAPPRPRSPPPSAPLRSAPQLQLVLFESALGFALFESTGAEEIGALKAQLQSGAADLARFSRLVKLRAFQPFPSAEAALQNINDVSEGVVSDDLRTFLEANAPAAPAAKAKGGSAAKAPSFVIGVAEPKIGAAIQDALGLPLQQQQHDRGDHARHPRAPAALREGPRGGRRRRRRCTRTRRSGPAARAAAAPLSCTNVHRRRGPGAAGAELLSQRRPRMHGLCRRKPKQQRAGSRRRQRLLRVRRGHMLAILRLPRPLRPLALLLRRLLHVLGRPLPPARHWRLRAGLDVKQPAWMGTRLLPVDRGQRLRGRP